MPSEDDEDVMDLVAKMSKAGTHEAWTLQRGTLHFSRWMGREGSVAIVRSESFNEHHSGEPRQLFYRAMVEAEFRQFEASSQLKPVDDKAFLGISEDREYVTKYFDGPIKSNATHVVEFIVQPGVDVGKELLGLNTAKPESGAMSFGLGPKKAGGIGGEYFNDLLKSRCIHWRLVEWKADPSAKKKYAKE